MDEIGLLKSRLDDLVRTSQRDSCAYFGFLNEMETSFAKSYLSSQNICFNFYGGFETAGRVFVSVCTDDYSAYNFDDFPITPLLISARKEANLSHRDYLGAIMGLGIKRECVGDIVTLNLYSAVAFVREDISSYLLSELTSVGRDRVKTEIFKGNTDSICLKYEEATSIVTSMRIDNVISSICNISRAKSIELIESDLVFVNYTVPSKTSKMISFGDTVSVRGYGKYKILEQVGVTKKDRLVIKILHYI